jgi:hypothetical protein
MLNFLLVSVAGLGQAMPPLSRMLPSSMMSEPGSLLILGSVLLVVATYARRLLFHNSGV